MTTTLKSLKDKRLVILIMRILVRSRRKPLVHTYKDDPYIDPHLNK